jgi:hypothetical protein
MTTAELERKFIEDGVLAYADQFQAEYPTLKSSLKEHT